MYGYSQDPLRMHALKASSSFLGSLQAAWAGARRWIAGSWLAKALAAASAERKARAAIQALRGWDDHMLRDVGLERMNIESAIRGDIQPHQWEPDCDPAKLRRLQDLH